ncbi:FecR family protein [Hwanghaeella sp. LZ110]|uniref:FecR family protein n=1 Tax=Hwanghaeella sp. LZ110 TaxID=3402810 RepID=UPI003B66FED9
MPERKDHATAARDQALQWFVHLNSGGATESDHTAFGEWLRTDSANFEEFRHLECVWSDLDHIPDSRSHNSKVTQYGFWTTRRAALFGGAGLALSTALLTVGIERQQIESLLLGDFRTGTGERRDVSLSDGSEAMLDAGTSIALDFTPAQRQIRLISGRAAFTVVHDPARPFLVSCNGATIRALGTKFVVHRRRSGIVVAVTENAVEVSISEPANAARGMAVVSAGQRITVGEHILGDVKRSEDDSETAWQRNRMVFRDCPLGDVVADLNRYRKGRIVILDDDLNNLRVDGSFNLENPDSAFRAIVMTLPVTEIRLTEYLVLLNKA